jgi:hypothetical protein
LLLLSLIGLAAGEKVLMTESGRKVRYEPKVTTCEPVCVFENKTNKWCFYTLDPTLRVGWEWIQVYGSTTVTDMTQAPVKYW